MRCTRAREASVSYLRAPGLIVQSLVASYGAYATESERSRANDNAGDARPIRTSGHHPGCNGRDWSETWFKRVQRWHPDLNLAAISNFVVAATSNAKASKRTGEAILQAESNTQAALEAPATHIMRMRNWFQAEPFMWRRVCKIWQRVDEGGRVCLLAKLRWFAMRKQTLSCEAISRGEISLAQDWIEKSLWSSKLSASWVSQVQPTSFYLYTRTRMCLVVFLSLMLAVDLSVFYAVLISLVLHEWW